MTDPGRGAGEGPGIPRPEDEPAAAAGEAPPPEEALGAGEDERIGIFPTWRWLYATVIVWAFVAIGILWILTVRLDYGVR